MSGLSRRRGGGGGHAASADRQDYVGRTTEGSADGHVVAYDPRDQQTNSVSSSEPVLTLMEEVLLLGLKENEGYISFWNDSISYVLRGCIMIELALRKRISMVNDPMRRHKGIAERIVEVTDPNPTGEVLLDEALKLMVSSSSQPMSVNQWIDCLSGDTWDFSKISYQLKQVRERLAKGLVDKGICRTEKRNFFIFDMATHPVADFTAKEEIRKRVLNLLTAASYNPPISGTKWFPAGLQYKTLRTISLVTSAYAANVLENAFGSTHNFDVRDASLVRADELLVDYADSPFQHRASNWASSLLEAVNDESNHEDPTENLHYEVVAAVFRVYTFLDTSF